MTNIKINSASGGYLYTEPYGRLKVLSCKPSNVLVVEQENGTKLELTMPYAECPNTLREVEVAEA